LDKFKSRPCKQLTAWGGACSVVAKFLERIRFREWVLAHVPVEEHSPNAKGIYEKVPAYVPAGVGVDVQGTMIRGGPEDVRREYLDLVDLFGRFNGGYIGGTSHSIMPETPLDNCIALLETALECQGLK
jgi:hypothetical protein